MLTMMSGSAMQASKGIGRKEVEKALSVGESQANKTPLIVLESQSPKAVATNPQEKSASKIGKEGKD